MNNLDQKAKSDLTILIVGGTGTGKTRLARIIHNSSHRADKPFIKLDMSTIPKELISSALFGHTQGSFSGAVSDQVGYFKQADGGTLFIDELQDVPSEIQAQLLSVIGSQSFTRVGSTAEISIDVRVICATQNPDNLRLDLIHRVNGWTLELKPLKEQPEKIFDLCQEFTKELGKTITLKTIAYLQGYSFPGNIRELKNIIKRAASFSNNEITINILNEVGFSITKETTQPQGLKEITAHVIAKTETQVITDTLLKTKGNKTKASGILEIDYKTLLSKIKQYRIPAIVSGLLLLIAFLLYLNATGASVDLDSIQEVIRFIPLSEEIFNSTR